MRVSEVELLDPVPGSVDGARLCGSLARRRGVVAGVVAAVAERSGATFVGARSRDSDSRIKKSTSKK